MYNYKHLAGYTHAQALRMYRTHGVRVSVALSPLAMRKAAQRAVTRQGLNELAAQQHPTVTRGTFQSDAEFAAELLAMRSDVADGMQLNTALNVHGFGTRHVA